MTDSGRQGLTTHCSLVHGSLVYGSLVRGEMPIQPRPALLTVLPLLFVSSSIQNPLQFNVPIPAPSSSPSCDRRGMPLIGVACPARSSE
jgi:hypothetical protein